MKYLFVLAICLIGCDRTQPVKPTQPTVVDAGTDAQTKQKDDDDWLIIFMNNQLMQYN